MIDQLGEMADESPMSSLGLGEVEDLADISDGAILLDVMKQM